MKTIRILPVLLLMGLCSSCVPLGSYFPLWDQEHTAELPGLAGTWTGNDGSTLNLVKEEGGRYAATFIDDDGASIYEVHAVALNGTFFLDFYPNEKAIEKRFAGEAFVPLVPVHFFARIVLDGDSLQLAVLDDDKVKSRAQSSDLAIPLLRRNDDVLLILETRTLQKLMERLAADASFWNEPEIFTRKSTIENRG